MRVFSAGSIIVVLAIIGIQSTRAAAHFTSSRADAYIAVVERDLQNLVDEQALHYADASTFAPSLQTLGFEPAPGVTVALDGSATGWAGVATHEGLAEGAYCAVFVGTASPPASTVRPPSPGRVICTLQRAALQERHPTERPRYFRLR